MQSLCRLSRARVSIAKEKSHKQEDCQAKKNGQPKVTKAGKFNGKCNLCGHDGHMEANCWEKEGNASKHPTNWKSKKTKTAAAGVQYGLQIEFLLCDTTKVHELAMG